ncbi:Chromodomain-helicase-DNA-binding protein 1-like, partial [Blyttiomyces sp. JEL0837]
TLFDGTSTKQASIMKKKRASTTIWSDDEDDEYIPPDEEEENPIQNNENNIVNHDDDGDDDDEEMTDQDNEIETSRTTHSSSSTSKHRQSHHTSIHSKDGFLKRVISLTPSDSDLYGDPKVQPKGLADGVVLRDYQLRGVQWMTGLYKNKLGGILADEMVVPLSLIDNWRAEIERFAGGKDVLSCVKYVGSKDDREVFRERVESGEITFDVLLVTYEIVCSDVQFIEGFSWQCLIVDEAHRLKNSKSVLHQTLSTIPVKNNLRILLTGTPIQNNLKELGTLLRFACGKVFGGGSGDDDDDYLVRWFGGGKGKGKGKDRKSGGGETEFEELSRIVKPNTALTCGFLLFLMDAIRFMLRREKNEVLTLPSMEESVLYIPMTPLQQKIYKSILMKDIGAFDASRKTSLMNILMQLRKCSNHPYMF